MTVTGTEQRVYGTLIKSGVLSYQFSFPISCGFYYDSYNIAFDKYNYLYAVIYRSIYKFDMYGNFILSFKISGPGHPECNGAGGIFVTNNDEVYVTTQYGIFVFSLTGTFIRYVLQTSTWLGLQSICIDRDNIYMYALNRIQLSNSPIYVEKYTLNGNLINSTLIDLPLYEMVGNSGITVTTNEIHIPANDYIFVYDLNCNYITKYNGNTDILYNAEYMYGMATDYKDRVITMRDTRYFEIFNSNHKLLFTSPIQNPLEPLPNRGHNGQGVACVTINKNETFLYFVESYACKIHVWKLVG